MLLHAGILRLSLVFEFMLYSDSVVLVRWALTESLGGLVDVDWAVSTTEKGNGLASSSRPGGVKRDGGDKTHISHTETPLLLSYAK